MLRNILLALGVFAALFAILIFSGKLPIGNSGASKPQGEVVVWGTVPATSMNQILQVFNPQAKTYRITYKEIREESFGTALLEALANGAAPDAIIAPQEFILSQSTRIYPFPVASYPEKKYKDTFVDGASLFYTPNGALALPITIDPLVLFYNRRLFSQKGIINPPQYWDDVTNLVPQFTQINDRGQFIQSTIALGAPSTPYAKAIIMAIVSQLSQVPVLKQYNPDGTPYFSVTANTPITQGGDVYPLATVLRFFTQFDDSTKTSYTWNDFAGAADDQFVAEKLVMYIGYASELNTLKARNPKADFDMSYLPQTRGYNTFTTAGRMYGFATLKTSKNLQAALTAEAQFSGMGVAPAIAVAVGGVPALRSYAQTVGLHEVIARSMLVAKGWYDTFPAQSSSFVSSMIADVVNGRLGPNDAASTFVARLQDLYTPH